MAQFIEVHPTEKMAGETELINVNHIVRVARTEYGRREDGMPIHTAQLFFADGSDMRLRETYDLIEQMIANPAQIGKIVIEGERFAKESEYYMTPSENISEKIAYLDPEKPLSSDSAEVERKPARPKKIVRRYYDKAKVAAFLHQHPELSSATDGEVARVLKAAGLMAPTTGYNDTSIRELRQQV